VSRCQICGTDVLYLFECNYCNGKFCVDHHLPENHTCAFSPKTPPPHIQAALEGMITSKAKAETLKRMHELKKSEHETKSTIRDRRKKFSKRNLALISLLLLITGCAIFVMMTDNTPPTITIISPEMKTYNTSSIDLTYAVNEPISWAGYSLDNAENITLMNNMTLSNLSLGQHELIIHANDTAGNIGFSKVSFTITRIFSSLNELIIYLREDDLSDVEWTVNYTCDAFAKDFIRIAESKGYYVFTYYALQGDEMAKFASIEIIIVGWEPWKPYWQSYLNDPDAGHVVVRTTINNVDVIVDPQTDIILTHPDFTVLYEGEITQD